MPKPPIDPSSIGKTPEIGRDKTLEGEGRVSRPDSSSFSAYKNEAPTAKGAQGEISPMDLASKAGVSTLPSFETLLAQAGSARDTLGEIEKNLTTPNLKFKKSQDELLNTKLTNANEHLDSAIEKMNGTPPENTETSKSGNPIERFVNLVTDGQNKLKETHDLIQNLKTQGGQLQASDMLLIQIKLAQAQQEIEYSSVLLSKVVDSLKQIISIQI